MNFIKKLLFRREESAYLKKNMLLNIRFNEYKEIVKSENAKSVQELSGRIRLLEEQQEIMDGFLREINKYLIKITEDKK